jgi:hypothetical protein
VLSQKARLLDCLLRGLTARRAAGNRSAEKTFQSFDEVRRAQRPAGVFRRSERGERGFVALIGNERRKAK